jgi:hypothetical protein
MTTDSPDQWRARGAMFDWRGHYPEVAAHEAVATAAFELFARDE